MSSVFDRSVFDEPDGLDAAAPVKKFKVAPTFVIDLAISAAYVAAVLPSWRASMDLGVKVNLATLGFAVAILLCYAAKVLVVSHLDRRGGDARAYVKSSELVMDGPYGWSRHPTYAVAMLQFLLWSALALFLQVVLPWNASLIAAAFLLPLVFFWINDRIVMPTEEAMLHALHPEAFEIYARRVRRWFGRYPAA